MNQRLKYCTPAPEECKRCTLSKASPLQTTSSSMPSARPELDDDNNNNDNNNNFDLDKEGLFRIGSESPPPLPSTPPAPVPVERPRLHPVLPVSLVVSPIPTSTCSLQINPLLLSGNAVAPPPGVQWPSDAPGITGGSEDKHEMEPDKADTGHSASDTEISTQPFTKAPHLLLLEKLQALETDFYIFYR